MNYIKVAKPNGYDFYTGKTINYRNAIGQTVRPPLANEAGELCSSALIHASIEPNDYFQGNTTIPCSAYLVTGTPVIKTENKCGFIALDVIREITNLDTLFGWRYSKAINPIQPLKIEPPAITAEHIQLVKNWDSVWASVWAYTGSLFPNIKKWQHFEHGAGVYPFQAAADLWKAGLVPSYDGKLWRLHGNLNADILWENTI